MIDRGATTIWETWKESDNTYSNCHPMFGSVTEWFYRWLGGIQPNPDYPGFKQFYLSPFVPAELDHVNSSYQSPFGEIISSWEKTESNKISFNISVPKGSSALFKPSSKNISLVSVNDISSSQALNLNSSEFNKKGIELKSGSYSIQGIIN